eukprot:7487710-Pyramimonas_sp.AAC.1
MRLCDRDHVVLGGEPAEVSPLAAVSCDVRCKEGLRVPGGKRDVPRIRAPQRGGRGGGGGPHGALRRQ